MQRSGWTLLSLYKLMILLVVRIKEVYIHAAGVYRKGESTAAMGCIPGITYSHRARRP